MENKKKKSNPVAKELLVSKKFKHKMEKSYKERIHQQNESELEQEKRDYINGKEQI